MRCAAANAPARLVCCATKFRKATEPPAGIVTLSHSDWTCPISVLPPEKICALIVTGTRLKDAKVACRGALAPWYTNASSGITKLVRLKVRYGSWSKLSPSVIQSSRLLGAEFPVEVLTTSGNPVFVGRMFEVYCTPTVTGVVPGLLKMSR